MRWLKCCHHCKQTVDNLTGVYSPLKITLCILGIRRLIQKGKRKVQGVPQSQIAALARHQEEEETDKIKQAQIEQTYEKH